MSDEYGRYRVVSFFKTDGSVGTEETIRHGAVLEKSTCDGQVELAIGDASIYEEEERKYAFSVCGKITGRNEGKFGIGGDGILDPLKSEFPCNRGVVVTSSKANTEVGELYERDRQFLDLLETQK